MTENQEKTTRVITPTTDPKYVIIDNQICNAVTEKPIPEDEPIFILRAKDKRAVRALRGYASTCTNEQHQTACFKQAEDFKEYAIRHGVREPDTAIKEALMEDTNA